jgi:cell division protein FtsW
MKNVINCLKKVDKILLICSLILFVFGLLMVFSASNVTSAAKLNNPYHYFYFQLLFLVVGLILGFISISFFSTKSYGKISWGLMLVFMATLIGVLIYGKVTNDAKSWLPLFAGIKFQPSEFAKVTTIVWVSYLCCGIKNLKKWVRYTLIGLLVGINAILIMMEPDFGTAIIYLFIVFMMILALSFNKKVKLWIVVSIIVGCCGIVLLFTNKSMQEKFARQYNRFVDFGNPCSEEKFYTSGNQLCNGYIAINNGNWKGLGLGDSTQKYLYLPEAYTDFIFAIIVEELGFIGGTITLIVMFICLWRIYLIGRNAPDPYGRLVCYGVFWYLLLHVIINLGGVFGLIPLTGVPLPFLSYGGSFMICTIMALSIVQRINIETRIEKDK